MSISYVKIRIIILSSKNYEGLGELTWSALTGHTWQRYSISSTCSPGL